MKDRKKLTIISSDGNTKSSRLYRNAIMRISLSDKFKDEIEIEIVHSDNIYEMDDQMYLSKINNEKFLVLEPTNLDYKNSINYRKENDIENNQVAKATCNMILNDSSVQYDRVLILGGGRVGLECFNILYGQNGYMTTVLGSKPSVVNSEIRLFDIIINSTKESAKLTYESGDQNVYDIAGNWFNEYGVKKTMRQIGAATVKMMLRDVIKG